MASPVHNLNLEITERHTAPFRYCRLRNVYDQATCDSLLEFFEQEAHWNFVRRPFYQEFELPLTPENLHGVSDILRSDRLRMFSSSIESAFGAVLQDRVEVVAHKMTAGHSIGIHNDFGAPWRSHRIVVWLNRSSEDSGGQLVLYNNHDPTNVHRSIYPENNSGVAFALTSASYHSVTEVTGGTRYSIVYSFWRS